MTVPRHQLVKVERVDVGGTNAWVVGDGDECVVIDAPPDAATVIAAVVARRRVRGILCTHGHLRHIASALTLSDITGADVHLHPDDYGLWHDIFPTRWPERVLMDGLTINVGRTQLVGIHLPGHTDGGMCWYAPGPGVLFTGDSLAADGPGPWSSAAGRSRLLSSIRARLFTLPVATTLHPGHGPDGRLGTVRRARDSWS
jgi:glyoxylase-like metal-dependent hydrolase (beta-lactamase superfamily II)